MARKIPLKTAVIIFLCCGISIILSVCMSPVDMETFLKSPDVGNYITNTVNKPTNPTPPEEKDIVKIDDQTGDGLKGGKNVITGLKKTKYYMVEKEVAPEGAPEPTNHYPMYVTEYTSPNPDNSPIPGQLIDDLGLITRINGESITCLTNLNTYTVRAATSFFEGLSFTYSDSAAAQDQAVSVSNGVITLPASKGNGNITLKNLDSQFNGYEVMGVSVKPAAFPSGSPFSNPTKKTIGKNANSISSLPLEGADTEVDYIFVKPDAPANFHVLKVIIGATPPTVITDKAIQGVTVPEAGKADVTVITNTTQYTGTVAWLPALENGKFKPVTSYTATITLTAKSGYTFEGVTGPFTVTGSTSVSFNAINAGSGATVTAVFPDTGSLPINIAAIPGIGVPVTDGTPVTTTATDQYTGIVTWSPNDTKFTAGTIYTATIKLTPKTGYTLTGVAQGFFSVANATTVTYSAGSDTVTAVFPATGAIGATFTITFTIEEQANGNVTTDPATIKRDVFDGQKTIKLTLANPKTGSWDNVKWIIPGIDPAYISSNTRELIITNNGNTFGKILADGYFMVSVIAKKVGEQVPYSPPPVRITVEN